MLSIVLPALVFGILLGLVSAPMGCLMLWRKMSFFSDSLAHGALLGTTIAAVLHFPAGIGALCSALLMAFLLWLLHDKRLPTDALLAMLASSLLCLSIVISSAFPEVHNSLMAFLLGDLLNLTWADLWWLLPALIGIAFCLARHWRQQILCALDEDFATAQNINPQKQRAIFIVLLALFTVLAIKAVGALLLSALMVIPALTARIWSYTPNQMLKLATGFSLTGIVAGIAVSTFFNTPTGAAIVLCLAGLFLITYAFNRFVIKSQSA